MPAHVCIHTHAQAFQHETLGVKAPRRKQQEGKVAGGKGFAASGFGIEVADKQKGTKLGFGDLAPGVRHPISPTTPRAWRGGLPWTWRPQRVSQLGDVSSPLRRAQVK